MLGNTIHRSASISNTIVQTLDFLAICLGGWLSFQFRFASGSDFVLARPEERFLVLMLAVFSSLLFSRVYRLWPGGALASMVGRVTLGWLMSWMLMILFLMLTKTGDSFSRDWLVSWLLFATAALWLGRIVSFFVMAQMSRSGYLHKHILLVGDTQLITAVRDRIKNATWSGYNIIGEVNSDDVDAIKQLDATLKPDEIWIGLRMSDHVHIERWIDALDQSVANIRLLPDVMMYHILNHGMSVTLGIPMVDISVSPMYGWQLVSKAVLDYIFAAVILVLLSPIMLVIAAVIKLTSEGSVLFKQKRHGWNGGEIWVYKFRTMVIHQEAEGEVSQAQKMDPRVTPFGRFLRKSSLDELPQFINVLQGRMSVVGPRPHALAHNIEYMRHIPKYALRHKVKPGITGWAQISGFRGETDTIDKMENRVKHDIYYLEHWSIWLDIKIILLTPLAVIQNKNAY